MLWEFRSSWRGRSWPWSHRLWSRAGRKLEATNRQHGPWPAHPPPSLATCQLRLQPGLPFPLPGRAGLALCQLQHVEPLRQSSDREPWCYLTLQREVLPQAGSRGQGLPGENSELAPCPQGVCSAQSGTLDRGAVVHWTAGPAMETSSHWDLRPWHCRQLSTKDNLCVGTHSHLQACVFMCSDADARALQDTWMCMWHA